MAPSHGAGGALPAGWPRTNEEFLERVFGVDWESALLCVKDMVRKDDGWPAGTAGKWVGHCTDKTNNFFSLSLFQGKHRRVNEWVGLAAIVIDDVGTKVKEADVRRVLGEPSWIVRTSVDQQGKGNHQWGYRLRSPALDRARVWTLSARLQLAFPDGDKMDPVHFVRLPYGLNKKEARLAWQPDGCPTALVLWTEEDFDLSEVGTLLQKAGVPEITGTPPGLSGTLSSGTSAAVDEDKDPIFRALDELGLVLGERRSGTSLGPGRTWDVRCPWSDEHTEREDEGAAYGTGGGFRCQHGHCVNKTMGEFKARLNELLLEQSGGVSGLAGLHFPDAVQLADAQDNDNTGDSSEDGIGQQFISRHGVGLRYDHTKKHWRIWRRGQWVEDETANVKAWICKLTRTEHYESRSLRKNSTIENIVRLIQADQRIAVTHEAWDPDLRRIGVPGGEADLRTGKGEAPEPMHMITKQTLVAPAPSGTPTPVWDRFLSEAMGGDQDMVDFIHTWFGYCLSGDTSWEKFAFFYGTGGNGKSTVTGVMSAIFKDYCRHTMAETFMERRNPAHLTEIARLNGVRLLLANEVPDNATFNVGRLKEHTDAGATLVGNFMRADLFQFRVTHKITLSGNHKPRLRHVDAAIKRRLLLVPFLFRPANPDPTLKSRLVVEYPGILRKLIDAGVEVHRALAAAAMPKVPSAVLAATQDYFADQDVLEQWLDECCVLRAGQEVGVAEAYDAYTTWCCDQVGEQPHSMKTFSGAVVERRTQCSVVKTKTRNVIKGLGLK